MVGEMCPNADALVRRDRFRCRARLIGKPGRRQAASVLQASGFRGNVTVFRLNAAAVGEFGSEPALRRNTAEGVYRIEAAHNPEVAGSNPAPATSEGLPCRPSSYIQHADWVPLNAAVTNPYVQPTADRLSRRFKS